MDNIPHLFFKMTHVLVRAKNKGLNDDIQEFGILKRFHEIDKIIDEKKSFTVQSH